MRDDSSLDAKLVPRNVGLHSRTADERATVVAHGRGPNTENEKL